MLDPFHCFGKGMCLLMNESKRNTLQWNEIILQSPATEINCKKNKARKQTISKWKWYYINALAEDAITWVNFKLFGTCCDCDADVYVGMAFCTTYTTKQSKMWRKYKKVAACSFSLCYISTVRWVPIIHLINYWMKLSHKFSLK